MSHRIMKKCEHSRNNDASNPVDLPKISPISTKSNGLLCSPSKKLKTNENDKENMSPTKIK